MMTRHLHFHGLLVYAALSICVEVSALSGGECSTSSLGQDAAGASLLQHVGRKVVKSLGAQDFMYASSMHAVSKSVATQQAFARSLSMLRTPRVLRSMSNKSILFYHVHVPRTGGTTVANLLMADICTPEAPTVGTGDWWSLCGSVCEMGLTDNMLSCASGRMQSEHTPINFSFERAAILAAYHGATETVFVTTLRPGYERLISQWAVESFTTAWTPPTPMGGNESLRAFLSGHGKWIADESPLARNNLQVSCLTAIRWDLGGQPGPTRQHLEHAKRQLLTGSWVIGFTKCLDKLHERLMQYGTRLHGHVTPKPMPHNPEVVAGMPTNHEGNISPEVLAEVKLATSLDDELYEWALNMAKDNPSDPRWAGC